MKKTKTKKKKRGYGNLVRGAYLGAGVLIGQGDGRITRETIIYSELVTCDAPQHPQRCQFQVAMSAT